MRPQGRPGKVNVNLMSGNTTTSAADLLGDSKSGHRPGTHPDSNFVAQFANILVGTLVTVLFNWCCGVLFFLDAAVHSCSRGCAPCPPPQPPTRCR
jgi:hypothetical protein